MIILTCNNISISFGERKILNNINFSAQDSDKIGIVGVNGSGKTTLLKIIDGTIRPESGEVAISSNSKIGYLSQDNSLNLSATIWDEVLAGFAEITDMETRINQLHEMISSEKNQAKLSSLMKEYDSLTHNFELSGGYEYNSRIRGILRGLGFEETQFDLLVETLSGGQRTRLSLAKLLLSEPDILLLDEPTNHLDLGALEWLEGFLKSYSKCVVVISHDRYFLDVVTNKIIELENSESTVYNGNYSEYILKKEEQRELQQKKFENNQREIARMEDMIEQFKRWNREKSIKKAESKQKALDKMERIDRPNNLPDRVQISFFPRISSAKEVFSVEGLSKSFSDKCLLKDINFKIFRGDRIFLLGPNGCGKSTLLKILINKLEPDSGGLTPGYNVEPGYFDQHQENLNPNNNIIDEVYDSNPDIFQTQLRNALAAFLFKGEDVFKNISVLSGGEKNRVALVNLMLSGANFLILDEPTNHLDINSREILESALQNYNGTILAVSHDRYFIKKLATRIFEISDCTLKDFPEDYSSYLQRKNANKRIQQSASQNKMSVSKLERINAKEEEARQRKRAKLLEQTEKEIHDIENRLKEIALEMSKEEIMSDHIMLQQLCEEQQELELKLESDYALWHELEEHIIRDYLHK